MVSRRSINSMKLVLAFLVHIAAASRGMNAKSQEQPPHFVLSLLVRRSLADSVPPGDALAAAPGIAPSSSAPSIPRETSTINPSGSPLPGPVGSSVLAAEEQRRPKRGMNKGVLASIILVPTIVCGSILLSSYVSFDSVRKRLKQAFSHEEEPPSPPVPPQNDMKIPVQPSSHLIHISHEKAKLPQSMDYAFLEKATNGFSDEELLGEGGFARVYRARLPDESVLAVKKLSKENDQAEQEFLAEIELMGKIHHPNLVSLVGFSSQGDDRLLIYELMRKGSLQDQLQGPAQGAALTWHLRLKIALDAARGLEYLHDQCNPPVIHRDFKSSNILLDAGFNAKLSDFGLALSVESGANKGGSLQLQGTFGYVAPEYILTGVLTEKSDVYAFGVVLLELITGRKPIDMSMPTGCQSLVTWATPQLTDRTRLPQIVDAAIKDTVNLKQLFQVAAIAVLCVQSEPSYRPLIGDVVNSLVPLVPSDLGGALRVGSDTGLYFGNGV